MVRNFEKYNKSLEFHKKMQEEYFNSIKNKLIKAAEFWKKVKNDLGKWNDLLSEGESMKFVFDKTSTSINYGECSKLNKNVTFIPNTCQLETQECFKHRKDE